MSLETAKLGFNRVHGGEMLCCTTERAEHITKAVNAYEASQATIEELQKGFYPQLEEALKDKRHYRDIAKQQKATIAELQVQVELCREALRVCNHYMPDIGQFCACGICKDCGQQIPYVGYEYCIACARKKIDKVLEATANAEKEGEK
jgi:hypothetical protein